MAGHGTVVGTCIHKAAKHKLVCNTFMADGRVHAYVLMSSNAVDVVATRRQLTFRAVGGVVDLRVLPGPTPEMVNRQLVQVIGRLAMPPRWALGFHQCKYDVCFGGKRLSVDRVTATVAGTSLPIHPCPHTPIQPCAHTPLPCS